MKNSLLQVRTRTGGLASEEAMVSYPVTVYVFQGEECRAMQIIGDEGQTLNIPLTEETYSVYAIGGASVDDYVLPDAAELTLPSPNETTIGKASSFAENKNHKNTTMMAVAFGPASCSSDLVPKSF